MASSMREGSGPHVSALVPSVSTPTSAPPVTIDFPIAIHKGKRTTASLYLFINLLLYHRLSLTYCACISAFSFVFIPKTTQEALSHSWWRQTITDEM